MIRSVWIKCAFVLGVALATAGGAAAGGIVVSSGHPGGHYDSVSKRLQVVLNSEMEQQVSVELHNSQGSIENLNRLADSDSPVNIALTQADALSYFLADHPDFAEEYVVLTDLGKECVFLLTANDGGIKTATDLHRGGGQKVAVGDPLSGSAITYRYMQRIDPRYAAAPAENMDVVAALLDIKSDKPRHDIVAAIVVQRPLAVSAPIEIVIENQDLFRIVPIREGDVKGLHEPGQKPSYSLHTVSVGVGTDFSAKFETLCTPGLILASKKKIDRKLLEEFTGAVLRSRSYLVPGKRLQ